MKKINEKKFMEEMISMIMYTRSIDKANGFKQSIGIIDKEELGYEAKIKQEAKECLMRE